VDMAHKRDWLPRARYRSPYCNPRRYASTYLQNICLGKRAMATLTP